MFLFTIVTIFISAHAQIITQYAPLSGNQEIEQALLAATNKARVENGVARLTYDEHLALAARQHAAEMAKLGYMSHESPNPATAFLPQRVAASGSASQVIGENISAATNIPLDARIGARAVRGWLDSPRHRENLLDPEYTHVGFGVASMNNERYLVQVLAYQPFTVQEARVNISSKPSYQIRLTLSVTGEQDVHLNYERSKGLALGTLSTGTHTATFTTEQPTSIPVSVGIKSANGSGYILQDDGWITPEENTFQAGKTSPKDYVSIQNAQSGLINARVYNVTMFLSSIPNSLSVWLDHTPISPTIQGQRIMFDIPEESANPTIHLTLNDQADPSLVRVIASLKLENNHGKLQFIPSSSAE